MTTLANRPNAALLVVDVQSGVVENAHARDAVVANVGRLVEKARQAGVSLGPPQPPGRAAGTVDTEDVDFSGTRS